jgi:hypothetical protein
MAVKPTNIENAELVLFSIKKRFADFFRPKTIQKWAANFFRVSLKDYLLGSLRGSANFQPSFSSATL